jgi:GNAT superfamily N-acetyltransferase
MLNITLRPLNLESDAAQYVELVNTIMPDPVTVERVREWDKNFPRDGIRQEMVALDENQCIVGCNEASHRPNMLPHTFFIEAIVLPNFRGRGIGTRLYDNAVEFARAWQQSIDLRSARSSARFLAIRSGARVSHRQPYF